MAADLSRNARPAASRVLIGGLLLVALCAVALSTTGCALVFPPSDRSGEIAQRIQASDPFVRQRPVITSHTYKEGGIIAMPARRYDGTVRFGRGPARVTGGFTFSGTGGGGSPEDLMLFWLGNTRPYDPKELQTAAFGAFLDWYRPTTGYRTIGNIRRIPNGDVAARAFSDAGVPTNSEVFIVVPEGLMNEGGWQGREYLLAARDKGTGRWSLLATDGRSSTAATDNPYPHWWRATASPLLPGRHRAYLGRRDRQAGGLLLFVRVDRSPRRWTVATGPSTTYRIAGRPASAAEFERQVLAKRLPAAPLDIVVRREGVAASISADFSRRTH